MYEEKDTRKANKAHCGTCANVAHYGLHTSLEETSIVSDLHQVRNQHSAVL